MRTFNWILFQIQNQLFVYAHNANANVTRNMALVTRDASTPPHHHPAPHWPQLFRDQGAKIILLRLSRQTAPRSLFKLLQINLTAKLAPKHVSLPPTNPSWNENKHCWDAVKIWFILRKKKNHIFLSDSFWTFRLCGRCLFVKRCGSVDYGGASPLLCNKFG